MVEAGPEFNWRGPMPVCLKLNIEVETGEAASGRVVEVVFVFLHLRHSCLGTKRNT